VFPLIAEFPYNANAYPGHSAGLADRHRTQGTVPCVHWCLFGCFVRTHSTVPCVPCAIFVILEQLLFVNAAQDDMIDIAFTFSSCSSWHVSSPTIILLQTEPSVNTRNRPLCFLFEHTVPSPVFPKMRKAKKAKNKARGVISSSRRGAYLGVLSEHKEPSPVFLHFFFRINRPLSHPVLCSFNKLR